MCYTSTTDMIREPWGRLKSLLSSTYIWSLFFVGILGLIGGIVKGDAKTLPEYIFSKNGETIAFSFGGPLEGGGEVTPISEAGAIQNTVDPSDIYELSGRDTPIGDDGSLPGLSSPLSNVLAERNGVKTYKIQEGDTLSEIAAQFGVSMETLRWANPGLRSLIRIGEEIVILPVTGILYEVREGDSIESVASRYRVPMSIIAKYNPDHQKLFDVPGEKIVLPHAKPLAYKGSQKLPDMRYYFALPARGWNWGALHYDNAVDIADKCGSPIYASAEGLVVEESAEGYWNDGYGNYITIEHPNGTRTKYSHIETSLVKVGDYVAQGDQIATIGNTGKTHGPTGCHLHFEIDGAKNPFAIR